MFIREIKRQDLAVKIWAGTGRVPQRGGPAPSENVELPCSILAWLCSNPLIKRNWGRPLVEEVFADVIPAYLYSPGLLNLQMSDWVNAKMPGILK
jgi:hypothetical protein